MQDFPTSPKELIASFWRNRGLILALTKREVVGRYQGSILGVAWSLFNPILMLSVYTFVFSVVFKARWGIAPTETKTDFALLLFVGMIVYGLFAECINRSPGLIPANANYVKKVVFPLEVLPWVAFGSALFHTAVSLLVLLAAELVFARHLVWTAFLFPLVLLPLMFGTMGCAWFLAGLGVYIRDMSQITGMLTTVLLFLSPVFYPISSLPSHYQVWLKLNPLAFVIEGGRSTLIFGQIPDVRQWVLILITGLIVAWAGFYWFQRVRKGFADVI